MISKYKDTYEYVKGTKHFVSSSHPYVSYINVGKNEFINDFITEYRRVMKMCLDEIWNRRYTWMGGSFYLKRCLISGNFPSFLQTQFFNCLRHYKGFLSGQMLSNCVKQLAGILRGLIKSFKQDYSITKLTKPDVSKINVEIPPKFVKSLINDCETSIFKEFVVLVNFTKTRNENVVIPIKTHKMDDKFSKIGNRILSILLSEKSISFRYEIRPDKRFIDKINSKKDNIVGADPGMNKIVTFSNNTQTPKTDSQGKIVKSLMEKAKRKKNGSKSKYRCTIEINNFINECLNNVDISDITHLKVESNKGLKQNTGNANHNWNTQAIYKKLLSMCKMNHVDFIYTPSPYKSQRCFSCGFVHKKNRNKEEFKCLNCHHELDADYNASLNNSIALTYDVLWSYNHLAKDCGFFWNLDGCKSNDKPLSVA